MSDGRTRVAEDAAAKGLDVTFVHRPEARNLDEAALLLGLEVGSVIKSLVVKKHDGTFLFALVPGGRRISWPKLRSVVGANKLQLPPPESAFGATGFERGTISPLGSRVEWPVYADTTTQQGLIALGAGEDGWSLLVDSQRLLSALGAVVADISERE